MARRALKQCSAPGCFNLIRGGEGGRCPDHLEAGVNRDPEIERLYHRIGWYRMRRAHLDLHPWCEDCVKVGEYRIAREVDHIVPHNGDLDLFFDDKNLQSLCKSHHSSKTAREVWHS